MNRDGLRLYKVNQGDLVIEVRTNRRVKCDFHMPVR